MHLPTGIDILDVLKRAFTPSLDQKCEDLAQSFAGTKIILGHDPMHNLCGLDKKLQATLAHFSSPRNFDLLLSTHTRYMNK